MCPGYLSIPSNHAQELSWKMLCVLQKAYNLTGILNSLDHPHCTVFIYVCFCDIDSYKLFFNNHLFLHKATDDNRKQYPSSEHSSRANKLSKRSKKKKITIRRKPMKANGNPRDPKTIQPCGIGFQ